MRRNLKIVLMAGLAATTFLSALLGTQPARAQSGGITMSTDENGRKIYVNDGLGGSTISGTGKRRSETRSSGASSGLMYWSTTEHRFKPVPTSGAVMRAARSAAFEVNTYLDGKSQTRQGFDHPTQDHPSPDHQSLNVDMHHGFTQQDIDAAIDQAAARHNVDPNLVRSVVKVESNFNPNAVSRKGAMGLMQLMPATARSLNVSNPFDPQQNVDAGVRHLKKLLENYGGNVRLSLAAYNAGTGAVARSAGVPHFAETQNYVRRITDLYAGGGEGGSRVIFGAVHADPVRVERDEHGVLHMSNTE
ncbi:MAG: lytic transglycosylase domain-containing protein [Terriglobales bacterium]